MRRVMFWKGTVSVSKHKDTNATEGVNAEGGNVERDKAAGKRVERGKAAGSGVDTAMQSAKPEATKKSDRTRAALLTAALAIISKKGYSATTVDEICKQAGIAKGSVYYYFKTKEEIGACILQEQTTQLVALLQACKRAGASRGNEASSSHEIAGHRTETDARQVLTAMLAAFSDFAFSNPPFTHFLMRELWREERAWSATMQAREQEVIELIAQEIRLGQREGIYRKEIDVTFAAISLIGMVITNTLYATAPHTHQPFTKAEFQQRVFSFSHAALCV